LTSRTARRFASSSLPPSCPRLQTSRGMNNNDQGRYSRRTLTHSETPSNSTRLPFSRAGSMRSEVTTLCRLNGDLIRCQVWPPVQGFAPATENTLVRLITYR
jgi:hypothetical protein